MRQFNQSGKGRLEFTGFDMQTPDVAMDEQFGPANLCELFDVITYFDQTTASRLLSGAGGSRRKN